MSKKYKKTKESSLSKKHKALLKTFLKDLINDLGNGRLDRENLVLKVNQKFKNCNLKPIYTKTKLSNSIANYRLTSLKKRNLNIKIPERMLNKKVVKTKKTVKKKTVKKETIKKEIVIKKDIVKEEPKTPVPDDKASANISHIAFYLGHDIPDMLFQEVIKCEELPVFKSDIFKSFF